MGIEDGITLLENVFFNTSFFDQTWLIPMAIVAASMLMITRVPRDWATVLLPTMVGWRYFGLPIPTPFFILAALIFIVDVLSIKVIGSALSSGVTNIGNVRKYFTAKDKLHRINVRDKMEEIKKSYKKRRFDDIAFSDPALDMRMQDPSYLTGLRGAQGEGSGDRLKGINRLTQLQRNRLDSESVAKKLEKERIKNMEKAQRRTMSGSARDLARKPEDMTEQEYKIWLRKMKRKFSWAKDEE